MLKKISFLFAALLATAFMVGCEQKSTQSGAPEKGKIENGEHGALTPGQAPTQPQQTQPSH